MEKVLEGMLVALRTELIRKNKDIFFLSHNIIDFTKTSQVLRTMELLKEIQK